MLKHGILGLLNYREFTGYDLMRIFRDSLCFFWEANTSQIYRELAFLKEKGFVAVRKERQEIRPDKKIFSITEEGRMELQRWLVDEGFSPAARNPLLMRMFFMGELSDEESRQSLENFADECSEYLRLLEKTGEEGEQFRGLQSEKRTKYWDMCLDYQIRYMAMLEKWCRDCCKKLSDGESDANQEMPGYTEINEIPDEKEKSEVLNTAAKD